MAKVIRAAIDIKVPGKGVVVKGRDRNYVAPEIITYPELEIHTYAPGDGMLSFVARTKEGVATGTPTREECESLVPNGWELFADGPYWRARKMQPIVVDEVEAARRWANYHSS